MDNVKLKVKKCLIEGCKNHIDKYSSRGLCHYHYLMVGALVKNKKRTWKEFEDVGMALKSIKGRNSFNSVLFRKMINKKFKK